MRHGPRRPPAPGCADAFPTAGSSAPAVKPQARDRAPPPRDLSAGSLRGWKRAGTAFSAARSPPREAAPPLPTPADSRQRVSAPRPKNIPQKDTQSEETDGGLWQKLSAHRGLSLPHAGVCTSRDGSPQRSLEPGPSRCASARPPARRRRLLSRGAGSSAPPRSSPSNSSQAAASRSQHRRPAVPVAPPAPQLHPLYKFGMFTRQKTRTQRPSPALLRDQFGASHATSGVLRSARASCSREPPQSSRAPTTSREPPPQVLTCSFPCVRPLQAPHRPRLVSSRLPA